MRPVIAVTLLIRLIFAVNTFDLVYIMTRGGPGRSTDLISYFIYRSAFVSLNIGQASAMSVILLLASSWRSPPVSTATCARSARTCMADIRLDHVNKLYPGDVKAVRTCQPHIRDGEFIILLGPSGCGKSTTLRMIAGLESISSGDLYIGERAGQRRRPARPRPRLRLPELRALSAYDGARQPQLRPRLRQAPAATRSRAGSRNVATMLGIGELLDRKPARSSRAASASAWRSGRALVREPVAFLLDEPLSNLDAKLRASMRTELVKLHRTLGRTIVHVTHDQVEAMTMGERICIMKDGRVVQVGAPMEVYRNPANTFVAGFLGLAADEPRHHPDARGRDGRARGQAPGLVIPWPEPERSAYAPYRDREVVVGIRAEDLRVEAHAVHRRPRRCRGRGRRGAGARGDLGRRPAGHARARAVGPPAARIHRAGRHDAASVGRPGARPPLRRRHRYRRPATHPLLGLKEGKGRGTYLATMIRCFLRIAAKPLIRSRRTRATHLNLATARS